MSGHALAAATAAAAGAGVSSLPFPVLDAFLGISAAEFFGSEWQHTVRVFPAAASKHRLTTAAFDFRAVVASATTAAKLEILGAKGRSGPKPGEEGWPLVPDAASARVSRANDYATELGLLCRQITEEVSHRVAANLYVSPPQSRGLDRHQDGHDVLILQVEGRKRWRIWKSDAPPPLDPFPALTFEGVKRLRNDYRGTPFGGRGVSEAEIKGQTEWNLELGEGDLIYVPRGWAHEVWTEDSHSAHLTFGFHLVSWVDLLMTVVAQSSRRHAAIRANLPIGFARVSPDVDEVRAKCRALLGLLGDTDGAEAMEEVIGRWLHRDMDKPPQDQKTEAPTKIEPSLRLRRGAPAAFVVRTDSVGLFRPSERSSELWFPKAFADALRFVATVEPPEFEVRDLPGVSPSSRARLCELLMAAGYLQAVSPNREEISA